MAETFREQLSRVEQMASGDDTWDLSEHDIAALKAVLGDRQRMAAKLNVVLTLNASKSADTVGLPILTQDAS